MMWFCGTLIKGSASLVDAAYLHIKQKRDLLSVVYADNKSLFCLMGHPSIQLFGEKVRYFRKRLNITQEELADEAGFHRTYIGQIERSERNPAFKNVVTLCQALQVPLSEFFLHYEGLGKPTHEKV